jgi:hypothetical protein
MCAVANERENGAGMTHAGNQANVVQSKYRRSRSEQWSVGDSSHKVSESVKKKRRRKIQERREKGADVKQQNGHLRYFVTLPIHYGGASRSLPVPQRVVSGSPVMGVPSAWNPGTPNPKEIRGHEELMSHFLLAQ